MYRPFHNRNFISSVFVTKGRVQGLLCPGFVLPRISYVMGCYVYCLWFLCRLPFWQRHIVLPVSQKTCHHQKFVFQGSYVSKYFIELKSVDPKFSVYIFLSLFLSLSPSLSLYISVIGLTFKFRSQFLKKFISPMN